MPKSALKSALKAPTSIKTKRPKGAARSKGKGGLLTVHHPPEASPKAGADERRAVLKWRAMELKLQGHSLRQICARLQSDFELVEEPSHATVDDWLDEAFGEVMTAKQKDADRHCSVILLRGEQLIAGLLPVATGQAIIRRTRIRDGQEIEILDESFLQERIAATGEIRKLMDQQAKLLKIGRVGEGKEGEGNVSGHALTLIVEKTVTNHIHLPGEKPKAPVTLVMETGDPDIDAMDSEALDKLHHASPLPI